jgi:hypothetical protein
MRAYRTPPRQRKCHAGPRARLSSQCAMDGGPRGQHLDHPCAVDQDLHGPSSASIESAQRASASSSAHRRPGATVDSRATACPLVPIQQQSSHRTPPARGNRAAPMPLAPPVDRHPEIPATDIYFPSRPCCRHAVTATARVKRESSAASTQPAGPQSVLQTAILLIQPTIAPARGRFDMRRCADGFRPGYPQRADRGWHRWTRHGMRTSQSPTGGSSSGHVSGTARASIDAADAAWLRPDLSIRTHYDAQIC